MAFQPVEQTAEVVAQGTFAGGINWANVFHRVLNTTLDATLAGSLSTDVLDFYDGFNNHLSTGWLLSQIIVTDLREEGAPQFVFPQTLAGTDSTQQLPPATSLVVTQYTDFRARSGRGRIYLCGFTEDGNIGGGPSTTVRTAVTNAAEGIMEGATPAFSVVTRYTGYDLVTYPDGTVRKKPHKRANGLYNVVTTVDVKAAWDTQRRRKLTGADI